MGRHLFAIGGGVAVVIIMLACSFFAGPSNRPGKTVLTLEQLLCLSGGDGGGDTYCSTIPACVGTNTTCPDTGSECQGKNFGDVCAPAVKTYYNTQQCDTLGTVSCSNQVGVNAVCSTLSACRCLPDDQFVLHCKSSQPQATCEFITTDNSMCVWTACP